MRSFSVPQKSCLPSVLAVGFLASGANAVPFFDFDYFGPLDEATFGGTRIPSPERRCSSAWAWPASRLARIESN